MKLNLLVIVGIMTMILCAGTASASDFGFTSEPVTDAYYDRWYDYEVTQTADDNLSLVLGPDWLGIVDDSVMGVPKESDCGIYDISLSLSRDGTVVYQNYTLTVSKPPPAVSLDLVVYFIAMIILFVLNVLGAVYKQVRILTLYGIFGIAIMAVPTALAFIEYGPLALILILINIVVPVMSTVNNMKGR